MIHVAHSPDSDDYFLFWAIRENKINCEELLFSFSEYNTSELNARAAAGTDDIVAISTAAYLQCRENYLVLPSGASVGRNYGPVVVSKKSFLTENLNDLVIGIPGRTTTAARVLKLIAPQAQTVEFPITPYSAAFSALRQGEVDAILLIHEGQILYKEEGLKLIVDLGVWWDETFHLPLPLGINVIQRRLGDKTIEKACRVIAASILYGLSHKEEAVRYLQQINKERENFSCNEEDLYRYLSMYANEDSLQFTSSTFQAIELLLSTDHQHFSLAEHLAGSRSVKIRSNG